MAHPQVDTPLRIQWDLTTPPRRLPESDLLRLADALVEAGVFQAELTLPPEDLSFLPPILERFGAAGLRTALILSEVPSRGVLHQMAASGCSVYLFVNDFFAPRVAEPGSLTSALEDLRAFGMNPGLSLCLFRPWIPHLRSLLEFALSARVASFKLPNIPLNARFRSEAASLLCGPEDLELLDAQLDAGLLDRLGDLPMRIHDLFVWERFARSDADRQEYAGCQAGNTLGFIDARGSVFPCASWPVPLGDLSQHSLEEIWQSPLRDDIRTLATRTPEECAGCVVLERCFGGCRGLACALTSPAARDTWCGGRRNSDDLNR